MPSFVEISSEVLDQVLRYIESPEGKQSLQAALEHASATIKKLDEVRTVDEDAFHRPYTL